MIKCNGCIHLSMCSSKEEKCQHYQSKADIIWDYIDELYDGGYIPQEMHSRITFLLVEGGKNEN